MKTHRELSDELAFYKERLRFFCEKYNIEFPEYMPFQQTLPVSPPGNYVSGTRPRSSTDENLISTVRKKTRRSRAERSN